MSPLKTSYSENDEKPNGNNVETTASDTLLVSNPTAGKSAGKSAGKYAGKSTCKSAGKSTGK